jgi:ribosomal protein S16
MSNFQLKKSGSRHRGCYATVFAESTARSSGRPVLQAGIGFKTLVFIQNLSFADFQLNRN